MTIRFAAYTHVGRRHNNEDAMIADPSLGLFAVADGMGGYEGGEVASRVAVDTVAQVVARNLRDAEATWPYGVEPELSVAENVVSGAIRAAHREVRLRKTGHLHQMGSTIAALTFVGGEAIVAHVGDSRVYRVRGGAVEQLTADHSLYAELARSGMEDLPPREQCQYGHVITRALGMDGDIRPDLRRELPHPGDIYLVCTDGLFEKLEPADLAQVLAAYPAEEACRRLVEEAYRRGGKDNITAVVVRLE